jgi:hypothetical protein
LASGSKTRELRSFPGKLRALGMTRTFLFVDKEGRYCGFRSCEKLEVKCNSSGAEARFFTAVNVGAEVPTPVAITGFIAGTFF